VKYSRLLFLNCTRRIARNHKYLLAISTGAPPETLHKWISAIMFRCISDPLNWCVANYIKAWIKIDQLDVTCFIISLFTAQHVSNVSTSIFRSLRLIVDLFRVLYCSGSMCVGVTVWLGWGDVVSLCRLRHFSFSVYFYSTIKMINGPINFRY
jgi:hypothetical protein